jgi:hypothetical protein
MNLKTFQEKLSEDKVITVAACGTKRTKKTTVVLELDKKEQAAS